MAARAGIEKAYKSLQDVMALTGSVSGQDDVAQYGAQKSGDLAEIIRKWGKLSTEIKLALMALVRASNWRENT